MTPELSMAHVPVSPCQSSLSPNLPGRVRYRVLDVVLFEEEDGSPFVGLLQVEAA